MPVQLTLDHLERPLPELLTEQWAEMLKQFDSVRMNHWGHPYYERNGGYAIVIQWSPNTLPAREGRTFNIYGQRRTEPYGWGNGETVEEWFESSLTHYDSSVAAMWLISGTQLAQLAGAA